MHIAKELGKSVEEVMQFSVLEIQLWASYFKIQRDSQQKGMNRGGNNKNRTSRRR
jgi:hypothetical protein